MHNNSWGHSAQSLLRCNGTLHFVSTQAATCAQRQNSLKGSRTFCIRLVAKHDTLIGLPILNASSWWKRTCARNGTSSQQQQQLIWDCMPR